MDTVKLEFYKDENKIDKPDDAFNYPLDGSIVFAITNWYEMYPNGLVKVNGQNATGNIERFVNMLMVYS